MYVLRFIFTLIVLPLSVLSPAFACGKDAPEVTIVYWSAKDCTWCTYWESGFSGMKSSFEQSSEFKKVNFYVVKRARIDTPPSGADYPQELAWLRDRIEKATQPFKLGVPAWGVHIDKKKVAGYWGTQTWNDKIFPEIRRIVNETCPS